MYSRTKEEESRTKGPLLQTRRSGEKSWTTSSWPSLPTVTVAPGIRVQRVTTFLKEERKARALLYHIRRRRMPDLTGFVLHK